MIKLEHVYKSYLTDDGHVVNACSDVSIQIPQGKIFGIIGSSGAGKSTVLKTINLLERPDSGKVIVDGIDLLSLNKKELAIQLNKIGSVIQNFNLFENRTVSENIAIPLKLAGINKKEIEQKVNELLALVELEDLEQAYPQELSDAQKQRVAIARAIANKPKILLLDEITSHLDPMSTKATLQLLKRLHETLNLTVVIVSHQMTVIKEVCDQVAVMDKGGVVEYGEVYSIFANPQKEVTKTFIKSASSLSKVEELIKSKSPIVNLKEGEKLVRLSYLEKNISEPLIATLTAEFAVIPNIIFADVEIVQGAPIGGTVAIFTGSEKSIEAALEWLKEKNVGVEILANG